jgi:hypothetical protein
LEFALEEVSLDVMVLLIPFANHFFASLLQNLKWKSNQLAH